jgi:hypothetical protein
MRFLAGVAVLVSAGVLVAAGGSSRQTRARLDQRMAAVARKLALVMNDSLPAKTAQEYRPASYQEALHAWDAAYQAPPRARELKGPWYVIVVRGRFVWNGPFRPTHGLFAARLWSPISANSGIGYSSLNNKVPASLAHLGRPTTISLRSSSGVHPGTPAQSSRISLGDCAEASNRTGPSNCMSGKACRRLG